ncbi:PEP-CTERM sorting domain-containing protein [Eleftheria terrae]|uniref:PEP-CTERM sorting domain-containing protein n=1 Tax=Eleftheria terrae TaxID=1597781 RepID=UPI00263A3FA1|nr:PEP-CTERM sorting domain-containing protein [Eleftheria terrae]WKB50612.1 PEP-CTERM sorting domain-containing protein [Eleftheria terrae]
MLTVARACALVLTLASSGHAAAALEGRDLGGGSAFDAYYDTELDITWLADANLAGTTGYTEGGWMDWQTAMDWVSSLDVHGVKGWRLPQIHVPEGVPHSDFFGQAETGVGWGKASELGHMFYVTLGNSAYDPPGGDPGCSPEGCALQNSGPFTNLVASVAYWTGTLYPKRPYPGSTQSAWMFETWNGRQIDYSLDTPLIAWAVHPGDVVAVPEPQTVALLAAGFAAILWRRQRAQRPQ